MNEIKLPKYQRFEDRKDEEGHVCIYKELLNKTFTSVRQDEHYADDALIFEGDFASYRFWHGTICCESVDIEDICGDLSDLENSPILEAEEVVFEDNGGDGHTWYKFRTIKGSVVVRWFGLDNYYGVSVDFKEIII